MVEEHKYVIRIGIEKAIAVQLLLYVDNAYLLTKKLTPPLLAESVSVIASKGSMVEEEEETY